MEGSRLVHHEFNVIVVPGIKGDSRLEIHIDARGVAECVRVVNAYGKSVKCGVDSLGHIVTSHIDKYNAGNV